MVRYNRFQNCLDRPQFSEFPLYCILSKYSVIPVISGSICWHKYCCVSVTMEVHFAALILILKDKEGVWQGRTKTFLWNEVGVLHTSYRAALSWQPGLFFHVFVTYHLKRVLYDQRPRISAQYCYYKYIFRSIFARVYRINAASRCRHIVIVSQLSEICQFCS